MIEDASTAVPRDLLGRIGRGLTRPHNWQQLVRFGGVGAIGYVVNLAVFSAALHGLGVDYRLAAVLAFLVAVTNNYLLNRRWTFSGPGQDVAVEAPRFLAVSVAAFLLNLALLQLLVEVTELPKVTSQALAIAATTPVNFVGNKLWTFSRRSRPATTGLS